MEYQTLSDNSRASRRHDDGNMTNVTMHLRRYWWSKLYSFFVPLFQFTRWRQWRCGLICLKAPVSYSIFGCCCTHNRRHRHSLNVGRRKKRWQDMIRCLATFLSIRLLIFMEKLVCLSCANTTRSHSESNTEWWWTGSDVKRWTQRCFYSSYRIRVVKLVDTYILLCAYDWVARDAHRTATFHIS